MDKLITIEAPEGALIVPKEMKLGWAIKTLVETLIEDKNYRVAWHVRIATAFKDEYNKTPEGLNIHIDTIANLAAENFLNQLCL